MEAQALAVPDTHTLQDLRESNRAGWKEGYLFAGGRIFRFIALPASDGGCRTVIRPTTLSLDDRSLQDGWSLLA